MSEKDEIRELLARYCFALDADRFEEMAALFTPDGVWETAFGTGTGRDGTPLEPGCLESAQQSDVYDWLHSASGAELYAQ